MSKILKYLKILLPRPIEPLFYKFEIQFETQIEIQKGQWVLTSLQGKQIIGMVLEIFDENTLPKYVHEFIDKIKCIEHVFSENELDFKLLQQDWFAMLQFIHQYYHANLGEVLRLTVPKLIKNGTFIHHVHKISKLKLPTLKPLKSLKGIKNSQLLTLNEEQQNILNNWKNNNNNNDNNHHQKNQTFRTEVLFGITGSGKTALIAAMILHFIEEYKKSAEKSHQSTPLQILVMVPEIGLTPQLATQLSQFLNLPILLLHSKITELQRFAMWQEATTKNPQHQIQIIVGTRLSILMPLPYLSLLIIDEEHDASFKQQEGGIPYCAKKVALWLAQRKNIPIILSSATPSLDTYYFAKNELKGYRLNYLTKRFFDNGNDTKSIRNIRNISFLRPNITNTNININTTTKNLNISLSPEIQNAICDALNRQEQVLLLHPRRGFSPVLQCGQCSWIPKCPACETSLIVHRQPYWKLRCHRCDVQKRIPQYCPDCGNQELMTVGRATQKIEEELLQLLKYYDKNKEIADVESTENIQSSILVRIDSDSTSSIKKREEIFAQAHHEANVLLGTQMISKGHDFANVGTIIILDVDALLLQPFLKSQERLFSLLLQTMGRGGRRSQQQTNVFIETNYQEQPVFQYAMKEDVTGFLEYLLQEREAFQLPPFSHQAKLKLKHKNLETLTQVSEKIHQLLENENRKNKKNISIFPPFSLAKQGYDYQMNINLQSVQRVNLHQFINQFQQKITELTQKKNIDALWDIDAD